MGKICIVKSLLLPQIIFIMQALVAPADIIKRLNTLFFRFIWKKKYSNTKAFEKVERKIMCQKKMEEGVIKVGHKTTRVFEYGAMRTAVEACAAKTEPCVENTKLSTDNHEHD